MSITTRRSLAPGPEAAWIPVGCHRAVGPAGDSLIDRGLSRRRTDVVWRLLRQVIHMKGRSHGVMHELGEGSTAQPPAGDHGLIFALAPSRWRWRVSCWPMSSTWLLRPFGGHHADLQTPHLLENEFTTSTASTGWSLPAGVPVCWVVVLWVDQFPDRRHGGEWLGEVCRFHCPALQAVQSGAHLPVIMRFRDHRRLHSADLLVRAADKPDHRSKG